MISQFAHLKNRNDSIPICRGIYFLLRIFIISNDPLVIGEQREEKTRMSKKKTTAKSLIEIDDAKLN